MSIWSNVSFKADISLLIFCVDDLCRALIRVLRSSTMIVFLSVSPFSFVSNCFIYFSCFLHMAHTFLFLCMPCDFLLKTI